jgi:hypothetical protein
MKSNLVVAVLGNRNSGKSLTWDTLFRRGRKMKTGPNLRKLFLTDTQYVEVLLVSGSPEERKLYVGDIIGQKTSRIVLCSMQYRSNVTQTIQYFLNHDYPFYVHWLNPGYNDVAAYQDYLHLLPIFTEAGGTVMQRDGKVDVTDRVQEMRALIFQWASERSLLRIGTPRTSLLALGVSSS